MSEDYKLKTEIKKPKWKKSMYEVPVIFIPHGSLKDIQNRLGCHRNTVRNALIGKTRTLLTEQIRTLAIESYNGKVIHKKDGNNNNII